MDEARTVPHDDQARPADGGAASPRGALAADGVSVHRLLVSALSTVANAVAIADTDGAIVWSNRACAALTGLEPEEALGRHLPSIGDPAEGPGGDTAAWAEVLAGRPWRGERRFGTGHGGEPRTVHPTLTPILDPDATVRYVVAVCDDVTDLERTRAELARRVAQQTAIAELSQYALGASDPRDVISEAERTLTELLGEELDTSVRTLAAKSPDECGSVGEG
ncbi:MAG: PAS domain-containing protein, partial [Actinomycetota bacterium]